MFDRMKPTLGQTNHLLPARHSCRRNFQNFKIHAHGLKSLERLGVLNLVESRESDRKVSPTAAFFHPPFSSHLLTHQFKVCWLTPRSSFNLILKSVFFPTDKINSSSPNNKVYKIRMRSAGVGLMWFEVCLSQMPRQKH